MQRCGQCGHELTDAAIKMGYCPNCGSVLRVDGAPLPQAHVTEGPYATLNIHGDAPPQIAMPQPTPATPATVEAQPLPPSTMPVAPTLASSPQPTTPPASGVPSGAGATTNPPEAASVATTSGGTPPPVGPNSVPPQVIVQRSGGAGGAVAIALLVLVLAAGGVLYALGTNGQGPLAQVLHHSSASTAAASTPTVQPTVAPTATIAPTATAVPPTATPVPTVPPAPPNFTLYKAPDGSYGLNVPANWAQSPVSATGITGVNFRSSLTSEDFVQIDQGASSSFDPANIVDYVKNFATSSSGTSITVTQTATDTTIGSNTWKSAAATYQANGATHKVVGLAITHGDTTYLFFYDALASGFSDDPGTTYDTMVKSFTFLV